MISCTEFIPAYSELFRYLEHTGGKQAVRDFWEHIADEFLGNLRGLVEQNGIRGCWMYWSRTLNEEAADFRMELDAQGVDAEGLDRLVDDDHATVDGDAAGGDEFRHVALLAIYDVTITPGDNAVAFALGISHSF